MAARATDDPVAFSSVDLAARSRFACARFFPAANKQTHKSALSVDSVGRRDTSSERERYTEREIVS
jgi:hypothetical protein